MTTIKSYTSLEQSKVLAKILPLESADMRYGYIAPYDYSDRMYDGGYDEIPYPKDFLIKNSNFGANEYDMELSCWSLAALFNYLHEIDFFPNIEVDERGVTMDINYYDEKEARPLAPVHNIKVKADTFVDACYEMILKLNELKIL